ncbi:pseudouridine synthase, partial [Auricularia subglabra TFB-10046 SS5]
YQGWTRDELVARLHKLEMEKDSRTRAKRAETLKAWKGENDFDFSKCYRRKIALKFCYDGWEYNGLASQGEPTALPTVEAVLQEALYKKRLIDPNAGPAGCDWDRCGRTDKGVSAASQVVSLWIRTAKKEFPYVSMLNRVLPPSLRILAWAPVADTFSARFNCRYRHYKYFFSPDGIDLARMRAGAALLLGEHDFRNLCKLDAAKQISNFRRRIDRADISEVEGTGGALYVFDLIGTAFLWHQVRHIMAVLFMVGSGAEPVELMRALLNVDGADAEVETVDRKPEYQMADGLPLVLWDCAYDPADVPWVQDVDEDEDTNTDANEPSRLLDQMSGIHTRSLIQATMHKHFLDTARRYRITGAKNPNCVDVLLGAGHVKTLSRYQPVLQRKRLENVEVLNERWRQGKGARRATR